MAQTDAQPSPQPHSSPQVLEEPRIPGGAKAAAVGGGVIASVCCGNGLIAVIATVFGAGGVVAFLNSWVSMQGVTLISTGFAMLLVAGIAAWVTRRARAGLSAVDGRRVYGRTLYRLAAWGLGGYIAYFIIVNALLSLFGFEYATNK